MIIAYTDLELLVFFANAFANSVRRQEIKGGSFYGGKLTEGDITGISGNKFVRENLNLMVEDVAAPGTRQVEIRVVSQVEVCCLVGGCLILDFKLVLYRQPVGDLTVEVPRVTFLTIGTQVAEFDSGPADSLYFPCFPDLFIKSRDTAVEVVISIIGSQFVFGAIDGEASLGNAVCIAPGDAAEIRAGFDVAGELVIAQYHIARLTFAVRDMQFSDNATVISDFCLHPAGV